MNRKLTLLFAFLLLALMSAYSQKNVAKQNHYNLAIAAIKANNLSELKGHKTKCNKMEDDRKRLYMLIFNQLGRN